MNRYGRGGSRATNTTLCQKCLQRGHYSYECKAAAQERPYASRPSRTQQFKNPKLAPKLTDTALEESFPKKSIADQQLEKSTANRGRKRSVDDMDGLELSRKRSRTRSRSVTSYSSVSTISTRSSRSPAPSQRVHSQHQGSGREKRRRRDSSASGSDTYLSEKPSQHANERERNTRPRKNSSSPAERGRRRSRSDSSDQRLRRSSHARDVQAEERAVNHRKKLPELDPELSHSRGNTGVGDRNIDDSHALDKPSSSTSHYTRQPSLSPYSKRLALAQDPR